MEIKGQIVDIRYQNEINSYTIATLETKEEEMTIVGYLPFINNGDMLKLQGKMITHQEYGEQFKIETFEKIMPETLDSLEKYLANGIIKGIGPSTAKKIVATFGEDTIHVFKYEPEKLSQIKGISKEQAIEMGHEFIENGEVWQIVGFLEQFGISASNAKKIYKELGQDAVGEIENNPYILVDLVVGIDFKKIDKIAEELGIEYNSYKRITSGIKYSLMKISYNGHCCTLKENLIYFVKKLLQVESDDIEHALIELKVIGDITIEKREEEEWIYLSPFYEAELNIAQRIAILNTAKNIKKIPHFDKELDKVEKNSNITFSTKQKEAIRQVNNHNVCIITGGPGTGKTTIIKSIIEIYKSYHKKVVLCAPTGRAAKRMTETTGMEAKTLHRLLDIGKVEQEDKMAKVNSEIAPIDGDVIIIDEMSMVDVFLMNDLVKAIFQGTKLILVGDIDQLPSVGPGSILKDLIASEKISTIHLDKVFRQAAQSKIIVNSHRVNEGKPFLKKEETEENMKDDFFFIQELSQDRMLSQVISLCKGRLQNYGDYDFFSNIQILSPTKKGMLGTKELNRILQEELNPQSEEKSERKSGDTIFRVGDRIMQIKNNYDMFWEKKNPYEAGSGVFNGELGTIVKIDEAEKQIEVKFDDDKIVWYTNSDLDQIEHSYAITIHKAQGSEFDVVIIVVPPSSPMLLTRNLLYTSLTRAKELLIVISSFSIMDFMIQNEDNKKRNTGLEYKLEEIIK